MNIGFAEREIYVILPTPRWNVESMRQALHLLEAGNVPHLTVRAAPDALLIHAKLVPDTDEAALEEIRWVSGAIQWAAHLGYRAPSGQLGLNQIAKEVFSSYGRAVSFRELAAAAPQVIASDDNLRTTVLHAWRSPLEVRLQEQIHSPASASEVHSGQDSSDSPAMAVWVNGLPMSRNRQWALARSIATWHTCATPESQLTAYLRRNAPGIYNPFGRLLWLGGRQWFLMYVLASPSDARFADEVARRGMRDIANRRITEADMARHMRMMASQEQRLAEPESLRLSHEAAAASGSDPFALGTGDLPTPDISMVQTELRLLMDDATVQFFQVDLPEADTPPPGGSGAGDNKYDPETPSD